MELARPRSWLNENEGMRVRGQLDLLSQSNLINIFSHHLFQRQYINLAAPPSLNDLALEEAYATQRVLAILTR